MATAVVFMNADLGVEQDILDEIRSIPHVVEVHVVYDLIVKIEAESLDEVKETVTDKLRTLEKVRSTLTMIVV